MAITQTAFRTDEVHGSLLFIADRVIDLIYLKYLKAAVSYHKETRVETYPFARDAVREAVYNALIHCNWADNNPIQIRIVDDAMYISNGGLLPFGWTAETLLETHSSKPFNPDIARVFYRAVYIESWGRGIKKICDACKNLGTDELVYIVHGEDIMVKFHALQSAKVSDSKALGAISEKLNVTKRTVERTVRKLREQGKIERVGGKRYGHWIIHE